jgi:hypothetical protein
MLGFIIIKKKHMMMVMALDSRGNLLRINILPSKTQPIIKLKKDLLMLDMVDMDMVMVMG